MFEKEIEFIYNFYLNKIEKLNSFVTFEQLASANLHPALLQYVSAEIDYLIFEDRQKLLKESLFDYSGDKINEYFTKISEEIKLTKKFSKDYISKLLLHATSFNVNYVIRPNWSLIQFIFENESEKYVSEVKQILNYLYYYPYYKRILINYFNKKHLYKISEEELSGVLDKIDKINLENNFVEIVDESLSNIVDFINIGEVGNNRISKDVIGYFLIDKNFDESSDILNTKLTGSVDDKYKIDDYREIILSLQEKEETLDTVEEEQITEDQPEEKVHDDQNVEVTEEVSSEEEKVITEETEPEDDIQYKSLQAENETRMQEDSEKIEDKVEELIDENEFEPPDFDEGSRIEDTDVQEVYDMVIEEEGIEEIDLEDTSVGERLNINDGETEDFYLDELDEIKHDTEPATDEETESNNNFETDSSAELFEEKEKPSPSKLEDLWNDNVAMQEDSIQESLAFDNVQEEDSNNDALDWNEHTDNDVQQTHVEKKNIDIAELLKNRKITKIIENIFDYDVDAFEKTIEKISECKFEAEALQIVDDVARNSYLDESSKEIKTFKKIISDLFE